MLLVLVVLWCVSLGAYFVAKRSSQQLRSAFAEGETQVHRNTGKGKLEIIQLPAGLYTEEVEVSYIRNHLV